MVTQGKTGNGVVYEQYPGNNDGFPIIFFAGIGVRPIEDVNHGSEESSYLGLFPDFLNNSSDVEVNVVYQPGVSGGRHKPNFYSDETEKEQFKAGLDIADGRRFYPIGHSLGARVPIHLALNHEYQGLDYNLENILDGCAIAPFTTVEDAYTDPDKGPRTFLWFPDITLTRLLKGFEIPFYYPLHSQKIHDGKEPVKKVKAWKANFWINVSSGNDLLESDTLAEIMASTVHRHPLIIITSQDKIFDPDKQRAISEALESEVLEVDTGHRCFTNRCVTDDLISKIIEHYQGCLV